MFPIHHIQAAADKQAKNTKLMTKPTTVQIPAGAQLDEIVKPPTAAEMFVSSVLDQTKFYPDPIPVIQILIAGVITNVLTLKSFSLWHGKAKSRKTTVLALLISAYISRNSPIEQTKFIPGELGSVLFLDCEQGQSYAAKTMKMILRLAGLETSENLIYCDLREFSPKDRIEIVQAALEARKDIKLVVIDGLVDLMNDFMDASEGHGAIISLLRFCSLYDVHIAGVLHQNKGDKNARAHIGSIAGQKCEIEISTEVDEYDKNQSVVSCVRSRGLPFSDFVIRWDKGDLPHIVQDWSERTAASASKKSVDPSDMSEALIDKICTTAFEKDAHQKYSDLVFNIQLAFEKHDKKIGENKAKKFILYLQNQNIIKKEGLNNTKNCLYEKVENH